MQKEAERVAVFGEATPVDTASRHQEVEQRLQRERSRRQEGEDMGRRGSEEDREGGHWRGRGDHRDRGAPRYGGGRDQGYDVRGGSRERYGEPSSMQA